MKNYRTLNLVGASALLITFLASGFAQAALNWDGQSGVFLNTLAYPLAKSTIEVAAHNADLGDAGSVQTYNIAYGLGNNIEVGFTRYNSEVPGVKNQNNFSGKWQFLPESKKAPAVAVWAIHRSLTGGGDATDLGLTATKVLVVDSHAIVLNLGVRSTKALGLGLFGIGSDTKTKFEGTAAYFVTPKFIVAGEFKQQINAQAWRDIAFRYILSDKVNLDAGIANFGPGLKSQLALAATFKL